MEHPPLAAFSRSLSGESVSAAWVSMALVYSASLPIPGRLVFCVGTDLRRAVDLMRRTL
jgi:hypothetical protein